MTRLVDEAGAALAAENLAPFQAVLRRFRSGGRKAAARPLQPPKPNAESAAPGAPPGPAER
eukprot:9480492-Lingulodinium_polyedra.AAC.1